MKPIKNLLVVLSISLPILGYSQNSNSNNTLSQKTASKKTVSQLNPQENTASISVENVTKEIEQVTQDIKTTPNDSDLYTQRGFLYLELYAATTDPEKENSYKENAIEDLKKGIEPEAETHWKYYNTELELYQTIPYYANNMPASLKNNRDNRLKIYNLIKSMKKEKLTDAEKIIFANLESQLCRRTITTGLTLTPYSGKCPMEGGINGGGNHPHYRGKN